MSFDVRVQRLHPLVVEEALKHIRIIPHPRWAIGWVRECSGEGQEPPPRVRGGEACAGDRQRSGPHFRCVLPFVPIARLPCWWLWRPRPPDDADALCRSPRGENLNVGQRSPVCAQGTDIQAPVKSGPVQPSIVCCMVQHWFAPEPVGDLRSISTDIDATSSTSQRNSICCSARRGLSSSRTLTN